MYLFLGRGTRDPNRPSTPQQMRTPRKNLSVNSPTNPITGAANNLTNSNNPNNPGGARQAWSDEAHSHSHIGTIASPDTN